MATIIAFLLTLSTFSFGQQNDHQERLEPVKKVEQPVARITNTDLTGL